MSEPRYIPLPVALRLLDNHRSQFNPLRNLDPQQVVSYLEAGERGAYADLQWTYRFVEKRDATLRGCVRRLLSALDKLDWDIKVQASLTPEQAALATLQQQELRAAYERIGNLREAIRELARAEFRGFAHLEKVFEVENGRLVVTRLEPVPQWHWVRDGIYGEWQFNADARSGQHSGEPINPDQFVIREVEDPIDEIGLIAFIRKNLSQKDWDGFVERFGIPYMFIEMPPGARDEDAAVYQKVIEGVQGGAEGVVPNGTKLHEAGASNRGIQPFAAHLQYQDEQIVLAATSGLLTMLSKPQGIGGGASEEHGDTFADIALALAAEISALLQNQLDAPLLDELFPGQPHFAYFEIAAKDVTDVGAVFDHAESADRAGFELDEGELSERTGYKVKRKAQPQLPEPPRMSLFNRLFSRGAGVQNREAESVPEGFEKAALSQLLAAASAELAPLHALLADHLDRADFDPADLLADIEEQLPNLYRAMRAEGKTDTALLDILSSAAVSGLEAVTAQRTTAQNRRNKKGFFKGVLIKWLP